MSRSRIRIGNASGQRVIEALAARARARAAHGRRGVRLRRHDGAARRGRRRCTPRLLDRDPSSLPEGFAPDTPRARGARGDRRARSPRGSYASTTSTCAFPERRQDILELLVGLWEELGRTPSSSRPTTTSTRITRRSHQEGLRAFGGRPCSARRSPGTTSTFSYGAYVALEQRHVEKKVAALAKYASQQHRRYANPEYVWNLARVPESTSIASTRSASRSTRIRWTQIRAAMEREIRLRHRPQTRTAEKPSRCHQQTDRATRWRFWAQIIAIRRRWRSWGSLLS